MSVGAKTDSLQSPAGRSTGGIVGLLATATGLCVANLYYGQPLLDAIGRGLHTSSSTAALLITLTQAGYAAGLLLLLPLGDLVNRARFVPLMALTTAVALAAMALAPSAPLFLTAATVAGCRRVDRAGPRPVRHRTRAAAPPRASGRNDRDGIAARFRPGPHRGRLPRRFHAAGAPSTARPPWRWPFSHWSCGYGCRS